MTRPRTRFALSAALALAVLSASPAVAQTPARRAPAQSPTPAPPRSFETRAPRAEDDNARETRDRLHNVLRQYPPSLWEVLRLDPTLLASEGYLAPYPTLGAFLAQHPEVAHNPGFFIGDTRNYREDSAASQKIRFVEDVLGGLALLIGFLTMVGAIAWLLKTLVEYRRWLRLSKVQTEAHSKLLDRFSSNEDLLAYIQTPAGRRFLESAPIPMDAGPRTISAPVGRILWSVQAGLVAAMGGIALLYVSGRLGASGVEYMEIASLLLIVGMLALAIGIGFVISAAVSYALSQRLGLFDPPAALRHLAGEAKGPGLP